MMHFHGFKSKKDLKLAITMSKVRFESHAEETSLFGAEYKPNVRAQYCVCMDHPKRSRFANLTVDENGYIIKVQ